MKPAEQKLKPVWLKLWPPSALQVPANEQPGRFSVPKCFKNGVFCHWTNPGGNGLVTAGGARTFLSAASSFAELGRESEAGEHSDIAADRNVRAPHFRPPSLTDCR